MRFRRAFTLVELLVSLGVIAILLSLVIAGLRGARERGRDTVALSNLRSLGVTLELFSSTHAALYPFVEPGSRIYYEPPGGLHNFYLTTDDRWVARYVWPITLHDTAPWEDHYESWLCPEDRPSSGPPWVSDSGAQRYPSYTYSNSFVANPAVWTTGASPTDADLKPQRATTVAFPSAKAVMFERDRRPLNERADGGRQLVLAADGAAAPRIDAQSQRPVPNPLRENTALLYHDTALGILGRDF